MTDLRKAAIELLKSAPDHITEHWPELDEVCKALAQPEQKSAEQFWQGVYPYGWTAERVKNEMSDYHMILDGLSGLFDYITGGACSKENTDKAVIKMLFDKQVDNLVEERVKEELEALAQPKQSSAMDEWRSMVVVNLLRRCPNLSKHELRELAAHFESRLPFAQPEQEPVAWLHTKTNQTFNSEPPPSLKSKCQPLYTAPPSKPWVSLTDEEIDEAFCNTPNLRQLVSAFKAGALWAEAALRSKNG